MNRIKIGSLVIAKKPIKIGDRILEKGAIFRVVGYSNKGWDISDLNGNIIYSAGKDFKLYK